MNLLDRILRYLNTPVDATGLAVFRVLYGLTLLAEVGQFYYFRKLMFDPIPYIFLGEQDFGLALIAWFIAVAFIIVGFQTRIAAIVNYCMLLAFFATIQSFEYHMMYVDMALGFFLLIAPVERRLSVDSFRKLYRAPGTALPEGYFEVPRWCYITPILLAVAVVYFDSIFYKFSSGFWPKGLGVWFPASIPHINHNHWLQPFLNQEWLMLFMGYLTLVFETSFIFLMWSKRVRPFLMLIGMGLHYGIFVTFPIPWFGLGYVGIYTLMAPSSWWARLANTWREKHGRISASFNPNDDVSMGAKAFIDGLDFLSVVDWTESEDSVDTFETAGSLPFWGWFVGLPFVRYIATQERLRTESEVRSHQLSKGLLVAVTALFLVFQINATSFTPAGKEAKTWLGLNESRVFHEISNDMVWLSRCLFGITPHPVFMDFHFRGYNHIIAIVHVDESGKETWLPIINKDGSPGYYNYGPNWVKWTFRVNSPNIHKFRLERGIRSFTAFWAHQNDVDLNRANFKIKVKRIAIPGDFEKDFLTRQIEKPWQDGGEVLWRNRNFVPRIANIEAIK